MIVLRVPTIIDHPSTCRQMPCGQITAGTHWSQFTDRLHPLSQKLLLCKPSPSVHICGTQYLKPHLLRVASCWSMCGRSPHPGCGY